MSDDDENSGNGVILDEYTAMLEEIEYIICSKPRDLDDLNGVLEMIKGLMRDATEPRTAPIQWPMTEAADKTEEDEWSKTEVRLRLEGDASGTKADTG